MSSKMHKEQNPFVFSLLLNFPQKQDYHKQNRHTCIQILLAFPRNSRLLIPSPDNYISSLLRQIMAQIMTQNSGSVGRKMCNLPPQAAPGETAIMGFLATPSTTGDAHWRSDHGEMHNFLPVLFLPTPLPGPCSWLVQSLLHWDNILQAQRKQAMHPGQPGEGQVRKSSFNIPPCRVLPSHSRWSVSHSTVKLFIKKISRISSCIPVTN